jgi:hypothetical protein
MLIPHERNMGIKAVAIFQHAVNEDLELFIWARAHITLAIYAISESVAQRDIRLLNISCFTSGWGKRKSDAKSGKKMLVRKV